MRWSARVSSPVKEEITQLLDCGVEGQTLQWRMKYEPKWSAQVLLHSLPAQAKEGCPARWIFLRDAQFLRELRRFLADGGTLLLNFENGGASSLTMPASHDFHRALSQLDPALGPAVISLTRRADLYAFRREIQYYADYAANREEEWADSLRRYKFPPSIFVRTLVFLTELRAGVAEIEALDEVERPYEFILDNKDQPVRIDDPEEAALYRHERKLSVRSTFVDLFAAEYANLLRRMELNAERKKFYELQAFLRKALPPNALKTMGVAETFPSLSGCEGRLRDH